MAIRFALCNEVLREWEWPRVCRFLRETGYDGVEIAPFTLSEQPHRLSQTERREIRSAAEDQGLRITGLHWLLVTPPGLHLTTPDAAVREQTADFLRGLVGLAGDLGAEVMVLGSPQQRSITGGLSAEQAWANGLSTVRAAVPDLEARGVTLCIEPLPAAETSFLNTQEEAARFADELGSPWVRIIADVKSLCAQGDPAALIRRDAGRIAYVHANDSNRRGPGFGDVDFRPIAAALRDVGYDGWVSVEPFDYSPDPETVARESLSYLREAFGVS